MKIEEAKEYVEKHAHEGYFENQVVMPKEEILALLDKLDKPKPVVPQYVAEWLKKYRYAHTLLKVLNAAEHGKIIPSAVNDWILDNQYDFIKALFDGYVVETDE